MQTLRVALLSMVCLAAAGRERINLNREWEFSLGEKPGAVWESIALPHSFSLPYFRAAQFYVGTGWYRKHLTVKPEWLAARMYLEFDGAFQDSEVLINGQAVGRHQGGYTGFSLDITDWVKAGDNVLTLRVNNKWNAQVAPRAGEHQFCGGIYRDAYLVITDPLHVTWNGTFVTTPQVSAEAARVNVKTEVRNDGGAAVQCTIVNTVLDAEGRPVAAMRTSRKLAASETATFDQTSDAIAHPKLWHPDHPYLYSVRTSVLREGKAVDQFDSPLGFRWFEWTADKGFFLNGEHFYLRGANVHQDHAGWGIAVTRAGACRDVKLIKDAGFNFIRGSHYPHHPAFAEACDRLGIVYWAESVFWGRGGYGADGYWNASAYPLRQEDFVPFEESCRRQLEEMIRIDRNHPSVVVWSMSNEPFFTENLDRAKDLLRSMVKLSHTLDPTRPAAVGGAQRGEIDKLGDVAGYNGDGARLFMNPGVPNMVSEYGAVAKGLPGDYDPYFIDLADQPQYPWRSGQAIWAGFDYGTIAGRQGFKGILDYYRLPKRAWYWYRNEYRHIPPPEWPKPGKAAKLQLTADKVTIQGTDATDDCQIVVAVLDADGRRISNSPPVKLTVESGPGEFPTGPSIAFAPDSEIMIVDGQAAMEFRSYYGGQTRIRATSPGLEDAALTITTVGEPAFVAGKTPAARARPYVPADLSNFRSTGESTANVAKDRPSRASSEASGHPARAANDGANRTAWTAAEGDSKTWWQVDLEGFYLLSSTRVLFDSPGKHAYKIEISKDGISWQLANDRSKDDREEAVRMDLYAGGTVARYVRVTLLSDRSLAEVAVLATAWTQ